MAKLFPIAQVTLGLVLLCGMGYSYFLSYKSRSWPQVAGEIQTEGDAYTNGSSYLYTVGGESYRSSRIQFGVGSRDVTEQKLHVSNLGSGAEVTVRYNPSDPSMSTIYTTTPPGLVFFMVLGSSFIFAGILVWWSLHHLVSTGALKIISAEQDAAPNRLHG